MYKFFNIWFFFSLLISIFVIIPIITVFTSFFEETSNYYELLKNTFLIEYIFNSSVLLICVLVLTFIIGTSSAYLVSFFDFPFSNFFKWALILSFAVPPYFYAYSLTAFFENYGTAYTILKNLFGEGNYNQHIPKFDGMLGAILSISFSLFAYVYILARASFLYQSQSLIDLGKNLGFSKFESFYKIILPAARPAIVAGLSLVAMETLAEFGAVDFFSINTLTTGIYNSWIAFDDLAFANRISFFLLLFIFALFILENFSRKNARYHFNSRGGFKQKEKIKLIGNKSLYAFSYCFLIFFFSFLFPLLQMMYWTIKFPENLFDLEIYELLTNTLYIVILSSFILILFSLISYSLAFNGIKSGYEKINISVDESAYLLGYSKRKTFMNIHIPFLRNSLLFIIILISLEIIRELPITLILRPFNFETFATTAYISASEDLLEAAAVPSLFLILIASLFIIISSKYILRENNE